MTDSELNKALAEALYEVRDESYDTPSGRAKRISYYDRDGKWAFCIPPNYPNDLNACHAVEKMLQLEEESRDQRMRYYFFKKHLTHLVALHNSNDDNVPMWEGSAPARMRAEALLFALSGPV